MRLCTQCDNWRCHIATFFSLYFCCHYARHHDNFRRTITKWPETNEMTTDKYVPSQLPSHPHPSWWDPWLIFVYQKYHHHIIDLCGELPITQAFPFNCEHFGFDHRRIMLASAWLGLQCYDHAGSNNNPSGQEWLPPTLLFSFINRTQSKWSTEWCGGGARGTTTASAHSTTIIAVASRQP